MQTVITDKDLVERAVYTELFPQAQLNFCPFHALKSFRTQVTTEAMKITSAERNHFLEILQALAYSKRDTHEELHEKLKQTGHPLVIDYYKNNWHPIRHEWVIGLKTSIHFGNNTSNRIESLNQKIKQVVTRNSSFPEFFSHLRIALKSHRREREIRTYTTIQKTPCNGTCSRFRAAYVQGFADHICLPKTADTVMAVGPP